MEVMTAERCTATAIVVPPDLARVRIGSEAWTEIKANARIDRERWRLVGEALLIGRRLHKSKPAFGQWCRENGFGDMDRRVRGDAMWLVENWDAVWSIVHGVDIGHPSHVRQAYREAAKADAQGKAKPVPFTNADADYAMKLHRLAEDKCNANESGVARAKLEKLAEDHGITCEELVQKSRKELGLDRLEAEEQWSTDERVVRTLVRKLFSKSTKEELVDLLATLAIADPNIMVKFPRYKHA